MRRFTFQTTWAGLRLTCSVCEDADGPEVYEVYVAGQLLETSGIVTGGMKLDDLLDIEARQQTAALLDHDRALAADLRRAA